MGGFFRGDMEEKQLQEGLKKVFSITLALELVPSEVVSKALEMTWSLLEVIKFHWKKLLEGFPLQYLR